MIITRIEESRDFTAFGVDGGKVRSFAAIALPTRKCQILSTRFPAVLLRYYVVCLVRLECVVLVKAAIFAATASADAHPVAQGRRDCRDAHDWACVPTILRASAFKSIMRILSCPISSNSLSSG